MFCVRIAFQWEPNGSKGDCVIVCDGFCIICSDVIDSYFDINTSKSASMQKKKQRKKNQQHHVPSIWFGLHLLFFIYIFISALISYPFANIKSIKCCFVNIIYFVLLL